MEDGMNGDDLPVRLYDQQCRTEGMAGPKKEAYGVAARGVGLSTSMSRTDLQPGVGAYRYIDNQQIPRKIQLRPHALADVNPVGSQNSDGYWDLLVKASSAEMGYSEMGFSQQFPAWCVGTAAIVSGSVAGAQHLVVQSSSASEVQQRTSLWLNACAFKHFPGKVHSQFDAPTYEPEFRSSALDVHHDTCAETAARIPYYQMLHYQQHNQASMHNMPCNILHYVDPAALELYYAAGSSDRIEDKACIRQAPSQPNVRDWYEQSLLLARKRYKEGSFTEAYQILHNLHQINPTDVPTALLLGCTCYSLSMHQLSIYYNNLILQLDPSFAEALSNLGTTHRAIAQNEQIANQGLPQDHCNFNSLYHLSMAEKCYRAAIAIRPKYWDANINLSILLSVSGRSREAIEIYSTLECLLDADLDYKEKYDVIFSRIDSELKDQLIPPAVLPGSSDLLFDRKVVSLLCSIELNRIARRERESASGACGLGFSSEFSVDRRRDLYYAKGCIYHALGDLKLAKLEYHKGLAAIGIDLNALYATCWSGFLPPQLLSPNQALAALQSYQQCKYRLDQTKGRICSNNKPLAYTSCPAVLLPSLSGKPLPLSVYTSSTSSILQTLAKIYQDSNHPSMAITLYYYSLGILPTANACNNTGILLAHQRLDESVAWYSFGLSLDPNHVHLLTNIGSALKDKGRINEGVMYYQKAISISPNFYIVLVNLANVYKGLGRIQEATELYRRSLEIIPNFTEAFCNYVNALLFICDWTDRDSNLEKARLILRKQLTEKVNNGSRQPPAILPFHTFTYPGLDPWMIREISHRNAQKVVWNVVTNPQFPGFQERPRIALYKMLSELTRLDSNLYPDSRNLPEAGTSGTGKNVNILDAVFRFALEMVVIGTSSISVKPECSKNTSEIVSRFLDVLSGVDSPFHSAVLRLLHYPFPYPPPPPPDGILNIGYVSSDFNNHPLAHLMQSVFGMHDRSRYRVFCYALTPTDVSSYRVKIQSEADVFLDVSLWPLCDVIHRIANVDKIHILCNLNGYTKGARNEIFAARPAPVQMQFMGFAGTMGGGESYDPDNLRVYVDRRNAELEHSGLLDRYCVGESLTEQEREVYDHYSGIQGRFIDYLVADEVACPRKFVCNEPLDVQETTFELYGDPRVVNRGLVRDDDDANRMYTESLIYMPHSYFVNDHRQSHREPYNDSIEKIIFGDNFSLGDGPELEDAADPDDNLSAEENVLWIREQIRRISARANIFPMLGKDVVIYANFNQLYKIDPDIFSCWIDILKEVPNSVLWLLRFPAAGETQLRKRAVELAGEDIAQRIIFTDVALKQAHVYRGRVADVFLDTPECNAHTTAADIMWSGTPVVTYPRYDFKMCSRVCSSVAAAAGSWKPGDFERIDGGIKAVMDAKVGIRAGGAKIMDDPNLLAHWMITKSYDEYKRVAINLGLTMRWEWKRIFRTAPKEPPPKSADLKVFNCPAQKRNASLFKCEYDGYEHCKSVISSFYPSLTTPTHAYCVSTSCLAGRLRMRLFLSREHCNLFNTGKWVRSIEVAYEKAYAKFRAEWNIVTRQNQMDILSSLVSWAVDVIYDRGHLAGFPNVFRSRCASPIKDYTPYIIRVPPFVPQNLTSRRKFTRCIWVYDDEVPEVPHGIPRPPLAPLDTTHAVDAHTLADDTPQVPPWDPFEYSSCPNWASLVPRHGCASHSVGGKSIS